MQDEFYLKQMADKQVLGPILDVLLRTLPRDNLLCSACLELFMLIHKENLKDLIKQMVENYREKIKALAYIDTFDEMLERYDRTQGFTTGIDPYFESEDELPRRALNGVRGGMMEHLVVDQAQEDYWNMSDDDDELPGSQHGPEEMPLGIPNGSVTSSKPLVEYNSDEDEDDTMDNSGGDAVMTPVDPQPPISTTTGKNLSHRENLGLREDAATGTASPSSTHQTPALAAAAAAAATSPPERLSEKRRREEDEDDALEKLTQHKRRNSSSVAGNAAATTTSISVLRKTRSFSSGNGGGVAGRGGNSNGSPGGGGGGGGLRKIAISISPAVKIAAALKSAGEEEGGGGGAGAGAAGGGGSE
jgi:protein phosphatase-4 regulatory subunit 3